MKIQSYSRLGENHNTTSKQGKCYQLSCGFLPSCHIFLIQKPGVHLLRWYPKDSPFFILLWKGVDQAMKSEREVIGLLQKVGLVVKSQGMDV